MGFRRRCGGNKLWEEETPLFYVWMGSGKGTMPSPKIFVKFYAEMIYSCAKFLFGYKNASSQ